MGLHVADTVALLDGGVADGLGEVALAGAGWAEEEGGLVAGDEAAGGEREDEGTVDLLVEIEVIWRSVSGLAGRCSR